MRKTTYFSPIPFLWITFSFFNLNFQLEAQDQKTSIFDLFYSEEALKLEIEVNLQEILDNKNTNDYFPAVLQFEDKEEKKKKWEVEVRSRGKFRRRACQFPPLKIKFPKKVLKDEGFKKHNEFKLVTHCVNDFSGDEYLLREFLIYKLFSIVSHTGFRVQLIKATYKDQNTSNRIRRYAILVEDEEDLEDRLDSKVCEDCFNWPAEELNLENIHKVCLFQFMIGNTDWSFKFLQNVKLLVPKDSTGFLAAPYDFDFAGFVNAHYAVPDADYGLENCRQRYFIGYAEEEEALSKTTALFQSKKEEILQYIDDFKYLSKISRKDIAQYIESFYACVAKGEFLNRIVDPGEFD